MIRRRRNSKPETILQIQVVAYVKANHPDVLMTMCPIIKTSIHKAVELKRLGYLAGTPDLMFFEPRGIFRGLFIELKAEGGTKQETQIKVIDALSKRGYYAVFCKGYDEAVKTIENYLRLK